MKYPQGRLMVFCKAPEEGKVMTRLAKGLSEIGLDGDIIATKIHEFLALERITQATKNALASVELWCSPNTNHPFFRECEKNFPLVLKEQPEGDLGERMSYAFDDALLNQSYAVLIGTDCPGLDASVINRSFQYLSNNQCSVIGPAEDGGYVLIGLNKSQKDIFREIKWGSPEVLDVTLNRLEGKVNLLSPLWDLDRIDDLKRLMAETQKFNLSEKFVRYLDSIEIENRPQRMP